MFKFLKRTTAPAARPAASSQPAARRANGSTAAGMLDPLPVPEVQELDDESAWDQWEHSQMELDSRMGPLSAFDSVKVKHASPSQHADLDPFASVRTRKK